MANNLVVQLLLKTGTFSNDLKTAKGQIQNFQKGCQTAGNTLSAFGKTMGINIGSLAKLGGAAGAAVLAFKGFKDVMMSTETTADAFDGAISGCKGVVDALKVSLATADFSTFQNGLWGVFDAAKNARDALDDLQDAQLAYGYLTSKNRREAREAEVEYKTPGISADKKESARQRWEQAVVKAEQYASSFDQKALNTIKAQVSAKNTNIKEKNVTVGLIQRAMDINMGLEGDTNEVKEKIRKRADFIKKEAKKYASDSKRDQYYMRNDNQETLILDVLLSKMRNETLKGVVDEATAGEVAREEAASMRKAYNRAIKGEVVTKTPKITKEKKEQIDVQEGSLTYWKEILSKETTYRDAVEKGTDAWNDHNEKVEEARKKINEIEGVQEKTTEAAEGSVSWYRTLLSEATKVRDEIEYGTKEWEKQNEKVKLLESALKAIEMDINSTTKIDDILAVDPPTIDSLQEALALITQLRNAAPIGSSEFDEWSAMIDAIKNKLKTVSGEVSAPETSSWDNFNQAMANTSTIVSSLTNTFRESSEVTAASVLQMVATCLPAIGSLISAIGALTTVEAVEAGVGAVSKAVSTSKHWIEAIAAVVSLSAVVAGAIAAARKPAMERFATGGIVGGSSFTGDRVSAQVNSGEMILTKAQQGRLFKMANGGGEGSNQVTFHISGNDLVGVLDNNMRKQRLIG